MKINQFFFDARHARASGAPMETAAEDTSEAQQVTPIGIQLPFETGFPSLDGATAWLNSPPISAAELRGKVVLIDFWTYSCINWLRTLPYVRAWAEKYREQGVVVIGVHTPEFPFEHDLENVRRAARDMRVDYPIAIDNDFAIWRAFTNHYWPALYVVDAQGQLRYHHFGEGKYEQSERVLQHLLAEAGIGTSGKSNGNGIGALRSTQHEAPHNLARQAIPLNIGSFVQYFGKPCEKGSNMSLALRGIAEIQSGWPG